MKIYFNPSLYDLNNTKHKKIYSQKDSQNKSKIPFAGYGNSPLKSTMRGNNIYKNIKKLHSETEYDNLLNNLLKSGLWSPWWNLGNKFEQGIMPYAGQQDISARINIFLKTGTIPDSRYTRDFLENIISITDYALNQIDKTYGVYNGIVYRYGYTDTDTVNYVSASSEPLGAISAVPQEKFNRTFYPFYIIDVNSGHKVKEIQKRLNYNSEYIDENEILLDPGKHFEKVSSLSHELQNAKTKLLETITGKKLHHDFEVICLKEISPNIDIS